MRELLAWAIVCIVAGLLSLLLAFGFVKMITPVLANLGTVVLEGTKEVSKAWHEGAGK